VVKLNPEGSGIVYATYLGGSGADVGYGIAVDGTGAAYVTGQTKSPNFPTKNAYRAPGPQIAGIGGDAFVTKLDPKGGLAYSTNLGISLSGAGRAIAVDGTGKAYVTGGLRSSFPLKNPLVNFPEKNPLQPATGGSLDAFVTKLDPAATGEDSLVYSTLLGGPVDDEGAGIAVDSAGSAYVTGTAGGGFPTTKDPLQAASGSGTDAFVTKLSPEGSSYVYSTVLGGSDADSGTAIAVDSSGRAHVTGNTASPNFPTKTPFEAAKKGRTDGFLATLDPKGSALTYGTYLGGADTDAGGVAVDRSGKAYVAGVTRSDLPIKEPFQPDRRGASDAFVVKLDPKQSGALSLLYSTYLGGVGDDRARGIAVDPKGGAYVTGSTASRDGFPLVGALKATLGGQTDGFVAKLVEPPAGAPVVTGLAPTSGPAGTPVTITGTAFDGATKVRFGQVEAPIQSVGATGTKVTVLAPPHADGAANVTVVNEKASSVGSPASTFTYSDGGWVRIAGPARIHHTATVLADGRVLVAGGCVKGAENGGCAEPTDAAELYDPVTRKWAPTGRMGTARPAAASGTVNHTATLLPDDKVLVMGGSSAELYDPATGVWTPTGAPALQFQHSATLLPDGKVLRIDARAGQTELYDPVAGTWARVGAPGAVDRSYHTATLLPSGRVLVVGGDVADVFDPATATWADTAVPEIVRAYHTATLLPDGKVLLVGGRDASTQPTATSEIYDPEAVPDPTKPGVKGSWSAARSLALARYAHSATLLPSGKVLVAGGSYAFGNRLASAELFDPATGRWKAAGDMSVGRGGSIPAVRGPGGNVGDPRGGSSFTANPLMDGSILVVGGSDAVARDGVTSGLDSAELYGAGLEQPPDGPEAPGPARKPSDADPWLPAGGAVLLAVVVAVVIWRRRQAR